MEKDKLRKDEKSREKQYFNIISIFLIVIKKLQKIGKNFCIGLIETGMLL